MSLTPNEASRRRVRDAISALRVTFDEVPVVDVEWQVSPEEYERTRARHDAGTVGGAGTWTTRADGAVLLVRDEGGDGWTDPGGKHEPGESLVETAERETREETGVDVAVEGVAVVQHVRVHDAADATRAPVHRLIPVFEASPAASPAPTPSVPDEESVVAARWWRERPETLGYDALDRLPFPDD